MEMEHINENTIRVLIDDEDLEERGITMLDLLGNQSQIESFFYSILEEVDIDESFRENDMITFQVIPNPKGLELYISKDHNENTNPYAKLVQQSDQLPDEIKKLKNSEELKGQLPELMKNNDWLWKEQSDKEEGSQELHALDEKQRESVFVFDHFEELIYFADHVNIENGLSFLHYMNGNYYISLIQFVDESLDYVLDAEKAMALEFGEEADLSFAVLEEYGQELMKANALEQVRAYFSN